MLPKLGPLPQISHTAATLLLLGFALDRAWLLAGARLAAKAPLSPITPQFMREISLLGEQSAPKAYHLHLRE